MQAVEEHQSAYVLKVAGSDQHLLKQCPISQYKYVRACIAKRSIPQLMLMCRKKVYETIPTPTFHIPSYMRRGSSATVSNPAKKSELLWNTEKASFRVHIDKVTYVNTVGSDQVFVRVGLFHGTEPLCPVIDTKHVPQTQPRWDEWAQFELHTIDLPRAAKLCVSVCAVKRRNKNREDTTMLCWGNVNLFDYKNVLLSGKLSMNLHQAPREHNDLLFPLGETASSNYGSSNSPRDTPVLKVDFERPSHSNVIVVYPTSDDFKDYAAFIEKLNDPARQNKFNTNAGYIPAQANISDEEWGQLVDILRRDPLAEISEQEKSILWRLRRHCLRIPDILPRLLDAVKWNSRDDITQAYMLLTEWPKVSSQTALELLDCKYGDPVVRRLAVGWLSDMTDEDLSQYLLQLVQTLKYEPYLENMLSRLLLRRALLNRKIGHFFFWHLKCELQSQNACSGQLLTRFGLLLEAFCRGLGPYLKDLTKQVEALDKLTTLTNSLKDRKTETARDRLAFLTNQISQLDYKESLQCFQSPLDNNVVFGELVVEECRVMNSAKKPLWLVWKNHDPLADIQYERNAIIFKNGDDLRQDMLTLQVIKIMDHIWHMEGML